MPKGRIGQLSRSTHSARARAATAGKLSRLRGAERGTNVKRSAFADAVELAESKVLKKGRKKR
jgi:hypothetical protein